MKLLYALPIVVYTLLGFVHALGIPIKAHFALSRIGRVKNHHGPGRGAHSTVGDLKKYPNITLDYGIHVPTSLDRDAGYVLYKNIVSTTQPLIEDYS